MPHVGKQNHANLLIEGRRARRILLRSSSCHKLCNVSTVCRPVGIANLLLPKDILVISVAILDLFPTIPLPQQTLYESMATYSLIVLLLGALGLIIGRALASKRRRPPQEAREPPGPKGDLIAIQVLRVHLLICSGLPWIGRVHDIPSEKAWMKFAEWADQYGPIYQQTMMGKVP